MATYIPNEMNNALYELNRMLIQMAMQKRSLDQDESQFGRRLAQSDSQFEASHQAQLGRDAVSKRANTFTEAIAIANMLPEGQTIANSPLLHAHMGDLFPGFDPTDPEGPLGGWTPNAETLQSFVQRGALDFAKTLEGTPEGQRFMERATNQAILGTNQTTAELDTMTQRARIFSEGMNAVMSDPRVIQNAGRAILGLDPITRVTLPDGSVREWDTNLSASLSVDIWKFMKALEAQTGSTRGAARDDLLKSFTDQANKAGITMGPGTAMRVVDAYSRGPEAVDQLHKAYTAAGNTEGIAALSFFDSGYMVGQAFVNHMLRNSEVGQHYFAPMQILQGMEGVVGKDQAAQFSADFIDRLHEGGLDIPRMYLGAGSRLLMRNRFGAPPTPTTDVQSLNTLVPGEGQTPSINPLQRIQTPEQANLYNQMMRDDAQKVAAGTMTLWDVQQKYKNPQAVQAILSASRGTQSKPGGR
jgi:hypothetical protein